MSDTKIKHINNQQRVGAKSIAVYHRENVSQLVDDWTAEEVPVALVYNGISHVVMMATPKDLEGFALGFSLAEGIISSKREIYGIDIYPGKKGIEVHIELATRCFVELKQRRRTMEGRTGCGICGVEQLNELIRPIQPLPNTQQFDLNRLDIALTQLKNTQPVGQLTGCTHAAAWLSNEGKILAGCEDIGRHVALDKLLGLRENNQWQQGAVLVSSRASYEMVQKAAMCGVEILFAVSAATSLAIDVAKQCNLSLVGFCKPGRAVIYSCPERFVIN